MENFEFHAYTKMLFGKGQIAKLPEVIQEYGKKVLLVTGNGSIKRSGLYQQVLNLLTNFTVIELSGVQPNPKVESVREGARLCKLHHIDVILAVGGGSTLDCSKMIGVAACSDVDAWQLVLDKSQIKKTLPLVTILTMAATGSEMNRNAVISNPETKQKIGGGVEIMIPQVSICDPTYTYSLPAYQTAAGAADIMSHVLEGYFKDCDDSFVQDRFAEGLLKTCIHYTPIALQEPEHYSARANLMWASSMGLNGLCGSGKPGVWTCHPIEHELSAYYDITHGVGLAMITIPWMRYILNQHTVHKFADYAHLVWDCPQSENYMEMAHFGIDATENFFKSIHLPMHLSEVGIDDTYFELMAESAVKTGKLHQAYVPLNKEDVIAILKASL